MTTLQPSAAFSGRLCSAKLERAKFGLCTECYAERALATSPTQKTILCHPYYFHCYADITKSIQLIVTLNFLPFLGKHKPIYRFVACLVRSRGQVRHLWCLQNSKRPRFAGLHETVPMANSQTSKNPVELMTHVVRNLQKSTA